LIGVVRHAVKMSGGGGITYPHTNVQHPPPNGGRRAFLVKKTAGGDMRYGIIWCAIRNQNPAQQYKPHAQKSHTSQGSHPRNISIEHKQSGNSPPPPIPPLRPSPLPWGRVCPSKSVGGGHWPRLLASFVPPPSSKKSAADRRAAPASGGGPGWPYRRRG